jgi:hypothetical protein
MAQRGTRHSPHHPHSHRRCKPPARQIDPCARSRLATEPLDVRFDAARRRTRRRRNRGIGVPGGDQRRHLRFAAGEVRAPKRSRAHL